MSDLESARRLVAEALELPPAEIPDSADVESLPAWDSLGHVKILLAVEGALGRTLSSAELAQARGLVDVAKLLALASRNA